MIVAFPRAAQIIWTTQSLSAIPAMKSSIGAVASCATALSEEARMRFFFPVIAIVLLAASAALGQARQPNIVFIIADDLGYGDITPYGQKKIRTPNIQRIADAGMRFTTHYSGHNVCAPSRC